MLVAPTAWNHERKKNRAADAGNSVRLLKPNRVAGAIAIEALKERESLAELSKRFEVHANMISKWNRTAAADRRRRGRIF